MRTHQPNQTVHDEILTVTQLNEAVREQLEQGFSLVWIKGELSNVTLPRSGHLYFTLKDATGQVRCAMFKGAQAKLQFKPADGLEVLVRAQVSLYAPRGDYQLIVNHMEQWGLGQLQQAYEALKRKLQAEGLFEQSHKKPLPRFPKRIGVITSHTGAAIQDILSVLKRRYPVAPVIIYHTLVQGKSAAVDIAKAIQLANVKGQCDVLIVARGGGSLEDLWCFNEEIVARAIYHSEIPIVSGIGHEVDFTIADFVADVRAPTPSVAAETITPNSLEVIQLFQQKLQRLEVAMSRKLQHAAMRVDGLEKQLIHPKTKIQQAFMNCHLALTRIQHLMQQAVQQAQRRFSIQTAKLNALSPLATLARGYAIVTDEQNRVIQDVTQLKHKNRVKTTVANGYFISMIETIEKN